MLYATKRSIEPIWDKLPRGCRTTCYVNVTLIPTRIPLPKNLVWWVNWALTLPSGLNLAVDKSEALTCSSKYNMTQPKTVLRIKKISLCLSIRYRDYQFNRYDRIIEYLWRQQKGAEAIMHYDISLALNTKQLRIEENRRLRR